MDNKFDVIIIGSGLGGLQCGYILSREGMKVCILEQHSQIGGCLQNFTRDNCLFDTGVHFIGGLDEGQVLNRYFR
ncbi:MAG TPA: NAD(P)-binding protein, partial [Bacteroidales bacterium]|nr:NAD(P)-binding protein [Bacteroidales bacterium]